MGWLDIEPGAREAMWMVPEHIRRGLVDYIDYGREQGHFLMAVFEGDLFRAAQRADEMNIVRLGDIAKFIVWYAPSGCYGSKAKVEGWAQQGGFTHTTRTPVEADTPSVDGSA